MRRRRPLAEAEEVTELNLIPLIDVIMFLLIFFISTTSFMDQKGLKVDKPQAGAPSNSDQSSIILAVTMDGKIKYNDKEIGLSGVKPTVKRLCFEGPLPVVIQASQKSLSGVLIRVMDEAMDGGAKDVSLAAERGGG